MTTTDPTPASMGGPLSETETKELRRAIELGYAMRHELVEKALNERDQALSRVGVLEGQLATAQERLNTAEGRGITAEQVAAVINPGVWGELEAHASDLFKDPDERARYEASFAEAIRQTRAPSLAAAERVLAFFRPEPARALGLDGGGSDEETRTIAPDTAMDEFEAADEAFRRWE